MKKKKVITLLVIMSVLNLNTVTARADEACEDVIKAADRAIESQTTVINTQKQVIDYQSNLVNLQGAQIKDLSKQNNSIFSNPWLWLSLGIITGAIVTKR